MKTLYLCYFGIREPLVQTQVLPYLRELAAGGLEVFLLTFEPEWQRWSAAERQTTRDRLEEEGIRWSALAYHKRPALPATLYDVVAGVVRSLGLVRRHRIDAVHARAHVPGLIGVALKRLTGCRLVFDLRGLVAEEYQDAGLWHPRSLPFRLTKQIEAVALRRADRIVTLTERAAHWLAGRGITRERIHVIPCCVDFSRFAQPGEVEDAYRGLKERFTVVYAGSVTGLYLLQEMARFVRVLRERQPGAAFLVLTGAAPSCVRAAAAAEGLPGEALTVLKAPPGEVPRYLSLARVGLSFRKPTFSQIAASPTKVPEYLAAGLPVITNAGIGDTDTVVRARQVGVVVESMDAPSLGRAAQALLELMAEGEALAERCRVTAHEQFSLADVGAPRYRAVYAALGGTGA